MKVTYPPSTQRMYKEDRVHGTYIIYLLIDYPKWGKI